MHTPSSQRGPAAQAAQNIFATPQTSERLPGAQAPLGKQQPVVQKQLVGRPASGEPASMPIFLSQPLAPHINEPAHT
jgi:hypothetical protein